MAEPRPKLAKIESWKTSWLSTVPCFTIAITDHGLRLPKLSHETRAEFLLCHAVSPSWLKLLRLSSFCFLLGKTVLGCGWIYSVWLNSLWNWKFRSRSYCCQLHVCEWYATFMLLPPWFMLCMTHRLYVQHHIYLFWMTLLQTGTTFRGHIL